MSVDLSQVTLTQLRYAIAVADVKNFRLAAERCHVSQPALSMQIQKLEELLGVVLFDRGKKPVLVTDEAEPVLGQMRTILRETERLGQLANDEQAIAGPYRLGVIPTLSPTVLPLFLGRFLKKYPDVELTIEELQTHDIIERLSQDALDGGLAATPLEVPGLDEAVLGNEVFLAYLPPGDELARKATLHQSDLAERPLWVMPEGHCFRTQVLSYCASRTRRGKRAGEGPISPGVRFESGSFDTLIRLVDSGMGLTVLPELVAAALPAARRKAQVRPLVGPVPVRQIGFVTARSQLRRRVAEALEREMRAALEQALQGEHDGDDVLLPLG
ncbi:MAG TPA: hydrogen peroxide-inducible genes activator [Polyangiaceae bacterium]|nr:hydrogen peroxide-inducible genes activator [Polyangiaceae bacterium]